MDRRSALKWMGFSLAAAAMAGVAPLTHAAIVKDRKHGKKRLVFYFTATGNSLFVARQFSDTPLSIPQELKNNDLTYEADEIAFVCPDYAGAIPKIVREFVSKGTFKAPYIFSVITYGNACVNVAEYWDEFCRDHGVKNNYIRPILMVDNYLPVFDMNQQIAIDKHTDESLATILEDVGAHKDFIAPASSETGASVSWTFPRCSTSPRRPISAGMSSGTWASPLRSIGDSLNYFFLALRYTMDPSLWYFSEICLSASIFQSQTLIYRCIALHLGCGQNLNAIVADGASSRLSYGIPMKRI